MSSTVIAKNVQIGADGTASNNFTIFQPATPDGTLRIGNGNTGITSSLVAVTSAGNVGIGTSSPGAGSGLATKLDVVTPNGTATRIGLAQSGINSAGITIPASVGGLGFEVGATERMRIDSSGNVGIGTGSPTWKTTVVNGSTPRCLQLSQYATNNTDKYSFISAGHYTSSTYTDGFALIGGVGSSGANAVQIGGGIGETLASSVIQFYTAANNTTTVGTERMRIDSSGNVGIGGSSGGNRLYVQRTAGADFKGETYLTDGSQWIIQNSNTSAGSYSGAVQANDASIIYSSGTTNNGAFTIAQWSSSQRGIRIDTSGNFQFNSGYGSVATAYGCRAWVNFNGTGTVAIRASGNVSSITDNGTGDYTVNFATAMPDANYAANCSTVYNSSVRESVTFFVGTPSTTAIRLVTGYTYTAPGAADTAYLYVAIFR